MFAIAKAIKSEGHMKIFKKMKKGFTLVELVVVIAVIAILAAVSVGAYFGVTESANRSKLEQEGKQVHTAIQTISLAGNEHSSLTSNGLEISNPGNFRLALEESLGNAPVIPLLPQVILPVKLILPVMVTLPF